jgi:hypothetical protein
MVVQLKVGKVRRCDRLEHLIFLQNSVELGINSSYIHFLYIFFLQYWLDVDKQLNHQVGLPSHEPLLRFCVKFYTPDPSMIEEEYTRYLFGLQIKRDISTGLLQCNDNTAALMASYIVQGTLHGLQS